MQRFSAGIDGWFVLATCLRVCGWRSNTWCDMLRRGLPCLAWLAWQGERKRETGFTIFIMISTWSTLSNLYIALLYFNGSDDTMRVLANCPLFHITTVAMSQLWKRYSARELNPRYSVIAVDALTTELQD